MSHITENIQRILSELPPGVRLLAATKTQSADAVHEAILAGVYAAGENRVQEMTQKHGEHAYDGAPLHFIGRLQKNKVKQVVGVCDLIESVDSIELLSVIDTVARRLGIVQDALLEINIAREDTKTGFLPETLPSVTEALEEFTSVRIRGLMAIPPISRVQGGNFSHFAAMSQLYVDFMRQKGDNSNMGLLSMGMSGDYLDAAAAGANLVRVGTGIFGARHYGNN